MQPFRLAIAHPCLQDWNSMMGGAKFRHCASCDKDVIALAEMNPEDAAELLRTAKPHSLCLRVEHDETGEVIFRKPASPSNSVPRLMLTIGASLLLNACDEAPGAPAGSTSSPEKTETTQSIQQDKPSPAPSASSENESPRPANALPVEAPAAASATSHPASSASERLVKPHLGSGTRITTGCACTPGDKLCDCL
jgi:hypothetical protein